jgi:hypothetical protein
LGVGAFDEIRRVLNVRSVTSVRLLLTCCFQTELVVNTRPTVSDTRHDIASIHATTSDVHRDTPDADNIIPDVRHDVPNTHPIARTASSSIHRNKLKSREDTDGQKQPVSITRTLIVTEYPLTTA